MIDKMKMTDRQRQILGWIAVGFSTLIACFWAFWGIIENFHEGWYFPSLWQNLGLMLVQYLLMTIIFVAVALLSVQWPRLGGLIHVAAGIWAFWFFSGASIVVIVFSITLPLLLLGAFYWLGRPEPKKLARGLIIGLPLLTLIVCGIEPAIRVAGRIDDGKHDARLVEGNGVQLVWAPAGPGWPQDGVNWEEAKRRCRYLTEDGKSLADTPQDIWRLPTVDEAIRSMARHGQNSGGRWNAETQKASFQKTPDKESPLWDKYSKVIYWWTATEVDEKNAYIVVYNGQVWPRSKKAYWGYLGFRAVKTEAKERS